jgi:hypothetical protein
MSDLPLPNIQDTVAPQELAIPNFDDQIKQRWTHDSLCTATMTALQSKTIQGRPQLEITLVSEGGARQKFWARIGEPRSNWVLSRFVLPYVNEAKKASSASQYDYGTELMAETLMQYIDNPWIQSKMTSGISVRAITTVRDSTSQNSNRTVSLEYVHHDDSGSKEAFESIKNLKQGNTIARAKTIAQQTSQDAEAHF